jgi:hyperosmotically inducible protein
VFDHLEYRVDGRAVTLSGQVTRPTLKSDAERAVKDIQDVEEVTNNVEVLPQSSADDVIRWAVYRAIYSESGPLFRYGLGSHAPVHIIVDSGRVALIGQVHREADKTFAVLSARQVPGTFGVEDRITVAS